MCDWHHLLLGLLFFYSRYYHDQCKHRYGRISNFSGVLFIVIVIVNIDSHIQ